MQYQYIYLYDLLSLEWNKNMNQYNTYLIVWHKDVLKRYHHPNQSWLRVEAKGPENHHFLGQEGEDHETQERVQLENRSGNKINRGCFPCLSYSVIVFSNALIIISC